MADYSNFCSLQQLRHLCAHPVLGEKKELYCPNCDIVLGHIRNMLEGVFIKPAFQTKSLFDIFVKDISGVKDILVRHDDIKKYVESKYLDKFNSIELEYYLFKNLWKFVFKLTDADCCANRDINFQILRILAERHKDSLLEKFDKDKDFFSKNIDENNAELLIILIRLFNIHPEFFNKLADYKRLQIDKIIDGDERHDFKALAVFRAENAVDYIFNTVPIKNKTAVYLLKYLYSMESKQTAFDYCIKLYACSSSFDDADRRFDNLIHPYIKRFSLNQLEEIVKAVNSNDQLYRRLNARRSNSVVRKMILEKNSDFDFSPYPNFNV